MAIVIQGGKKAEGTLEIQGSKNALLPMLAATTLTDEPVTIFHCPELTDVDAMLSLLEKNGKKIEKARHSITITGTSHKDQTQIGWPAEKIRASSDRHTFVCIKTDGDDLAGKRKCIDL